jgi:hypothetical protein
VRQGFACLVLDTLEFGEVPGIHHGLHDQNLWHWLSLGYTPAGVEVWNAIRAIDYLATRPEVDLQRLGVTGISGGGAMSWYLPAVDERVAVGAPICGTYTFGTQAAHWRAHGQCDCIYFPNTYGLDLSTVAALVAPRPLLFCGGERDSDFPPDGQRAVFDRALRVYELYGAAERIRTLSEPVGHTYTPTSLAEVDAWMWRWLRPQDSRIAPGAAREPVLEHPTALRVLDRPPADSVNHRVHDLFVRTAPLRIPRTAAAWTKRRATLLRRLEQEVFGWMEKLTGPVASVRGSWDGAWIARYCDFEERFLETEPGVSARLQILRARDPVARHRPILVQVKRPGDHAWVVDYDELLPFVGHLDLLVLSPRFTEDSFGARERSDLEMSSAWSGRTIAGQQVLDVARCLQWASETEGLAGRPLSLWGKGDAAAVCLYAALLRGTVDHLVLADLPESHWHGPALLNVLRVTDLPEAAAAAAPARLTMVTRSPAPGFAFAKRVYGLLGIEDRYRVEPSAFDAVRGAGGLG